MVDRLREARYSQHRSMKDRRGSAAGIFISQFIGLMGATAFNNMAGHPRFATFAAIDVVRLLAAGGRFGTALAGLSLHFVRRRSV